MAAGVKTDVTELGESRVRVQAEVPAEEVERRVQQAARNLGRQLRIPGFRRGKVPPTVVIRRLGREAVLDEVVRSSLGTWYVEAIDRSGHRPGRRAAARRRRAARRGRAARRSRSRSGCGPRRRSASTRASRSAAASRRCPTSAIDAELERLRDRVATLETVERAGRRGRPRRDRLPRQARRRAVRGRRGPRPAARARLRAPDPRLRGAARSAPRPARSGRSASRFPTTTRPRSSPASRPSSTSRSRRSRPSSFRSSTTSSLPSPPASTRSPSCARTSRTRLRESEEQAIEREFEEAVLEAAVGEATVEVPDALVHARAHELLEQTLSTLERQGISKETYLQIVGKDEEQLAHEAEPEAASALRREAVLAAIVQAEGIAAERRGGARGARPRGRARRARARRADRRSSKSPAGSRASARTSPAARRSSCSCARRKPITVEQAKARQKLWTPGRGEEGDGDALRAVDARRLKPPLEASGPADTHPLHSAGIRPSKQKKRGT